MGRLREANGAGVAALVVVLLRVAGRIGGVPRVAQAFDAHALNALLVDNEKQPVGDILATAAGADLRRIRGIETALEIPPRKSHAEGDRTLAGVMSVVRFSGLFSVARQAGRFKSRYGTGLQATKKARQQKSQQGRCAGRGAV
jgi:hypothetical protein